ncbi:MAG: glutaredoxin family protein [Methylophilaceae bacterium]
MKLHLYGTSACHLCEEASLMLTSISTEHKLDITEIDIIENEELLQLYGTTIPVLLRPDTMQSLNWPFTPQAIRDFIADNGQ